MTKEITMTKSGIFGNVCLLGRYFLSALKGVALVTGGIGSLAIVLSWVLLLALPIFLVISFLIKFLTH